MSGGDAVSRTRKDSRKSANRVLEVVRMDDGTFDLFMNGKLDRGRIHKNGLNEQLCVRFGFCGDEYDSILRELVENGRKKLFF
jgi:hypothetical protein